MYQLFIVDDEEVVRKGIRELLQSAETNTPSAGKPQMASWPCP